MLFSRLSRNLEEKGHRVLKTTREYREVTHALKLQGIDACVVGKHGGKELADKLNASAERVIALARIFEEFKPEISISFSSPEMARTSYGLNIPHLSVNDSPHAKAVARLTVPLSKKLMTPMIIPKKAWTKYGIAPKNIVRYNALDPWAWLRDFKPNHGILEELGLDKTKPILTIRTEESFAAYLLHKIGSATLVTKIVEKLIQSGTDIQIVVVPRYEEQIRALREALGDRITVCEKVIDGSSLLFHTSVFIGAGGTMTAEAALLGIPSISSYPGNSYMVEKYLMKKKLLLRETNPTKIAKRVESWLRDIDSIKEVFLNRSKILVSKFEDPIEKISREIKKTFLGSED